MISIWLHMLSQVSLHHHVYCECCPKELFLPLGVVPTMHTDNIG